MTDLNIKNFRYIKDKDKRIYIFEIKNGKYALKRISNDEIIIVNIFNGIVDFNCLRNKEKIYNLDIVEKNIIINDIIDTLRSDKLVDFIDFDELLRIIKKSYNNIDFSNDLLGLSIVDNNLINVILLENNLVIGEIKIDYDVKVKVDQIYLKDTLDLLEKYYISKQIKKLIKK